MVPSDIRRMFENLMEYPLGPVYADDSRRRFFHKYPKLHGLNMCLFQIRHLKEIYGLDLRDDFLEVVNKTQLDKSARDIQSDPSALKYLSSFAVNHIYLLKKLYGLPGDLDPEVFLNMRPEYDESDPAQLNLLVYLFTHCVIAESNFYSETLPKDRLAIYTGMMDALDGLVDNPDVKLDAKLEYLVASRISGRISPLQGAIHGRLRQSPDGDYIIDPRVISGGVDLNSLNVSEHRNVLYIMSCSAYRPRRIRIG